VQAWEKEKWLNYPYRVGLGMVQVQGLRDLVARTPHKQGVAVNGGHQRTCRRGAHRKDSAKYLYLTAHLGPQEGS